MIQTYSNEKCVETVVIWYLLPLSRLHLIGNVCRWLVERKAFVRLFIDVGETSYQPISSLLIVYPKY